MQKLYDTYEKCYGAPQFSSNPMLAVGQSVKQSHIEITLDGDGNFRRACIVPKIEIAFPATEKSAGRTTNDAPHPLCDKIQYCASDYAKFGGKKKAYYKSYLAQLREWADSEFSHPKVQAVHRYVNKGTVVADLVAAKILHLDADGALLTRKSDQSDQVLFKYLTPKDGERDQGDAFIRWRIEVQGELVSETWLDQSLIVAWMNFEDSQIQETGFCFISGDSSSMIKNHPRRIRHSGDGAKLISSNDENGFTFRGRFTTESQAVGVSAVVSQKAHNALRWLIDKERKQAFHNGDQVIVAWAVDGKSLPDPFANSAQIFGLDAEQESAGNQYDGDAGQTFASRLRKCFGGYRSNLGSTDGVVVMGLDSASPGRLAITFYRELTNSEFLDRITNWHESFAWHQNFGKDLKFIGAPSPKDIADAAYGKQVKGKSGEKLRGATVERLLPCIFDGRPLPFDLTQSLVRRASNRSGLGKWEWEKCLGIACALVRGHHKDRNYQMTLELERVSRDYLFGRLLAVAESIESRALYLARDPRETNAAKLMQRFADRPNSTWRTIRLGLVPYMTRLSAKAPYFLHEKKALLDEISCQFSSDDFNSDAKLTGEFLLGYHCQRLSLKPKSATVDTAIQTEPKIEIGE
jgi:CRISPR-associated protein Csd1